MKVKISVLILFIVMLTTVISQVAANNEDAAESDNCPENLALLPVGSEVEYSPFISYGAVTNGSVDTSVLLNLHAYAMNYLQDIYPVSALLDDEMNPMLSDAPVPLVLGENHICVHQNTTTYVFREVTSTEGSGWIFAAIIISPIELTNEVIDEFTVQEFETLQMAPEIVLEAELVLPEEPITMDDKASINDDPIILLAEPTTPILLNAGFYFWKLIPDPFDPFGGENSKAAPEEHQACNNYTAISNLSVGVEAQMTGFSYVQFPNSDNLSDDVHDETWSDLSEPLFESEYAYNYYLDKRHTPIFEVPLTDVSNPAIIAEATTIFAPPVGDAPIATILDGPYCVGRDLVDFCEHHWHSVDFCEGNSEGGEDEYSVWWKIEVEIQGATYTGWYPENIRLYGWWLWEENGLFDRVATAYLLTPIGMAMSVNDDACYPTQFVDGMQVQAAQGALNLRATPNGDIIGSIQPGETFSLIGSPVQQDGYLWWWTNRNGWIAERECDNTTAFIHLVVSIVEPTRPADDTTVEPIPANPQPTTPPRSDDDTTSGGRGADSTPTPPEAIFVPPVPTRSPDCDPATGRGC